MMDRTAEEFEREFPVLRGIGDVMQTAVQGVEVERRLREDPMVKLLITSLRERASDALEQMLRHDLYAPDFTDHTRSCIGEILRHRDAVAVILKAILEGRQAERSIRDVERRG